ncbi:MAG: DUF87 domain-containing protein [Myxococcota bacterium]
MSPIDPRLAAFLDPDAAEVFTAVVHGNQVFGDDPFDVPTIHSEARGAFARLLDRASAPELPPHGTTLLLLGEAGSGKTHLMRAFRHHAHAHGIGYCGYLQMTSRSDNYARYILANLVDSLEQPYRSGATGLSRLARGVLDTVTSVTQAEREDLVDGALPPGELARLVHRMSSAAVQHPRLTDIDVDLLRALLYLLVDDGLVHALAMKWLRCEPLSTLDREVLGELVPRPEPEAPLRMINGLGRLMWAVHSAGLVLLVDQIEEVVELTHADEAEGTVFRRAVNALVDVADGLPNAVVVVACLEDLFAAARRALPGPKLDRLERDPEPVLLVANRTVDEVEALVARRLQVLVEERGVDADPADPTFPFAALDLAPLAGMRTRDVLDWCRRHRRRCVAAGVWQDPELVDVMGPAAARTETPTPAPRVRTAEIARLAQRWNDFLAEWAPQSTLAEATMAELVAWVAGSAAEELDEIDLDVGLDGPVVEVGALRGDIREDWLVAVCEGSARGGQLGRRLDEVAVKARGRPVVFVRSTPFPRDPKTRVAAQLAAMCRPMGTGRRVVVENADWRAMEAFRGFHDQHHGEEAFGDWRRADRPLTRLRAVRHVLDLDRLESLSVTIGLEPGDTITPAAPVAAPEGPIRLGASRGLVAHDVTLDPELLLRHAAIVGTPGCGTTTTALSLCEGLLLRGVPVVLLDRQGDLCRYADPEAWEELEPDPIRAAHREQLRERVAVTLYTPGQPEGRPLPVPLVPPDLGGRPEAQRDQQAALAAAALGGLMGYRTRTQEPRRAVLERAIATLAGTSEVTVPRLEALVRDRDPSLLAETAGIDDRHFQALSDDLQTVWLRHRRLLDASAGFDPGPWLRPEGRRVPLTLVTTRFLGDDAARECWVALWLSALEHWRAAHPRDGLAGVLVLDDADRWLPAAGRAAATRAALTGLLVRARTAGLGVVLVSRSPSELDDRTGDHVHTWLVGQVKERGALARLRPMLEAARAEPERVPELLPGQFQAVVDGVGHAVDADPCLVPPRRVTEERLLALAQAGTP